MPLCAEHPGDENLQTDADEDDAAQDGCLAGELGAELLMHIGIDTVKLGGKHFTYLVNEGDKVKKGQPLIRFELEAIKAEGYPVTTPLIVCNTDDYAAVAAKASGTVKQGDALLELKR